MPPKPSVKVGDKFTTNEGYEVEVLEYKNAKDVKIRFNTSKECTKRVPVFVLVNGSIKYPYHPSVCGVGYFGEGEYKSKINKTKTKGYLCWVSMLERAYSLNYKRKYPTYIDVSVCEEWHNFQNFAEWYYKQPNAEKEGFDLDKDLTLPGNKVYSPEACTLVPKEINYVTIDQANRRGDCPRWVSSHGDKYVSYINISKKRKHLGVYETPDEAFDAYKKEKSRYLRELAERHKDVLCAKVYKNLIEWEIKQ